MVQDPNSREIKDGDSCRSRLLVWPKVTLQQRRQRQEIAEKGWVLGWKSKSSNCETYVCAGILDSSKKTLAEYKQSLEALKANTQSCACLTTSLDIIANWSAKNRRGTQDLPTITNEKQYPWFVGASQSNQQLLYYNQYLDNKFAHLASMHGHQTDWSLLIHRINHSREILELVENVEIPSKSGDEGILSQKRGQKKSTNTMRKSDLGIIQRLQEICYSQSLTLQHFHQMTSNESFLYSVAAFRCASDMQKAFFAFNPQQYTCSHCQRHSIIPSRSTNCNLYVRYCNTFWSSLFDMLFGLLVASLLYVAWKHIPNLGVYHLQLKTYMLHDDLLQKVYWLETFPAGFKLNVKLTNNLGYEIRNILNLHYRLLNATTWNVGFCRHLLIPCMVVMNILFGFSGFLAIFMDLMRYELAHIFLLASCFRNLYRAELYLLSALWRLFRGKKRNVLRKRTDSMQYDAMQLFVGTIVFCICIFLWTTIWVYYTFFIVWNVAMHFLFVIGLWVLYTTTRSIPWASLWFRVKQTNWFPTDVNLRLLLQNDQLSITRLVCQNRPLASILWQSLQLHLKPLSSWLIGFFLQVIIPRSSNPAPCSMPFGTLLEGFIENKDREKDEN